MLGASTKSWLLKTNRTIELSEAVMSLNLHVDCKADQLGQASRLRHARRVNKIMALENK